MEKKSLTLTEMMEIFKRCERKREKERAFLALLGIEVEEEDVSEEELLLRLTEEEREDLALPEG